MNKSTSREWFGKLKTYTRHGKLWINWTPSRTALAMIDKLAKAGVVTRQEAAGKLCNEACRIHFATLKATV